IYLGMNTLKDGAYTRTKLDLHEIRHLYRDFDYQASEACCARDPEFGTVLAQVSENATNGGLRSRKGFRIN
ncbi:MAG: hypothetical protein ACREBQ_14425, partial [Nitrososphaerales archaeon]